MKIGDLVKWYELYDDMSIVKDAGFGIIVKKYVHEQFDPPIETFVVLRSNHDDEMVFERYCLEVVSEVR